MTVQDYLRVFRERWLVLAVAAGIGLAVGLGAFLLRPAQYTAQISLYVSAQVGADPQQAYLGAQLSEQRVKSYTGLITSPRVMKDTVAKANLPETPDQLAGKVSASSSADSIVIDVAVTQATPQQAAAAANTIGTVFTGLVDELERPSSPNNVAPVAIRVVQPADVPQSPSSTGLPLSLAIGLFAGLVVGAGVVLARNALDTSLRAPGDVEAVTGAPNLGVIAFDPEVPKHPLLVREDPQNPRSEAFRQLRTNLQFVDVDSPRKVLMVTSSMPAEGKSTTVANLALALSAAGAGVLLIEADLRRPKLADLLGVERSVGLTRVLSGRLRFAQAVQQWGGGAFDVLSSGPLPPNPSELLGSRQMRALLDEARASYDVVLIDCPPLLPVTDAAALAPSTDGAVVVCRYKSTSRSQLTSAVQSLRAVSVEPLGSVFTMVPSTGPRAYAQYNAYYRAEERNTGGTAGTAGSATGGGDPGAAAGTARQQAVPQDRARWQPGPGQTGAYPSGQPGGGQPGSPQPGSADRPGPSGGQQPVTQQLAVQPPGPPTGAHPYGGPQSGPGAGSSSWPHRNGEGDGSERYDPSSSTNHS